MFIYFFKVIIRLDLQKVSIRAEYIIQFTVRTLNAFKIHHVVGNSYYHQQKKFVQYSHLPDKNLPHIMGVLLRAFAHS